MKHLIGATLCAGMFVVCLTAAGNKSFAAGTGPVMWFPDGQADSLKCYEVEDSTRVRNRFVRLEDEFGQAPPKRLKLRKPSFYCNPVVKDREAASVDPISPMACYRINARQPKRTVEIENAFGAQTLVIDDAKHLCVPSTTLDVVRGDRLDDRDYKDRHHKNDDDHDGRGDPADVPPVSTQILLSSSETVLGQKIVYPTGSDAQITAAIVTMQPGAETGLHLHEVPLFGYLIQGELTVTYETGFVKVLRPGDSLLEAIQTPHNGRNTSKGVVRIFVVFAGAKDVPNTVPLE